MRLLILFISFLISQVADSQIINASPPYRVRASGCATKLLDAYSGGVAAYSLRKLDADYAGSAIRVRESGGNTESDIGFIGCGDLDTTTLKTFCSTNSCYVVTWYNQGTGGSAFDVTQATAGSQPRIVNAGTVERISTDPSVYFDGSDDYLSDASQIVSINNDSASIYWVAKTDSDPAGSDPTSGGPVKITSGGVSAFHYPYTDGNVYDPTFTNSRKSTGNPSTSLANPHLYSVKSVANEWTSWVNNTQHYTTGTNTYSVNSAGIEIGRFSSSYRYKGYLSEVVIFQPPNSANRTGISSNINTYYGLY